MKLGIAIIGCGAMGNVHARAWSARDDARVASCFDPDRERCNALAEKHGAHPAETLEEAIRHAHVQAVSVCTPVCFHAEISVFAAREGKHVLSEKPIALTLDQADEMINTARDNRVLLGVSYQYRGFPVNLKLRELVQAGEFGGPVFARFVDVREVRPKLAMHRVSQNGGPIIDMAGHYFDLIRFATGEEPETVFARGHVFGKGKERLAEIPERDLAIDAAEITVQYGGGHVLSAFVNWGMPEAHPGMGGTWFTGPKMLAYPEGKAMVTRYTEETIRHELAERPGHPRIDDMAAAIHENRQPEVTGDDGRIALEVSLAALESIRSGEAVRLV